MAGKIFKTRVDQAADVLRQGIMAGRWRETLPGRARLAVELGCSHRTAESALRCLLQEGLLVSEGAGRRRRIELPAAGLQPHGLRVRMLLYEPASRHLDYLVELMHRLREAGHQVDFVEKSLIDLGMEVKRVARYVQTIEADAWVVVAASREVLEWFGGQVTPAFAIFGRMQNVAMAGGALQTADAYQTAVDDLVARQHRRIVLLAREERRKPGPGYPERCFLERLALHGLSVGAYNLPDWEDSPEGLKQLIEELCRYTPPTAMLIDGPHLFVAVREHLARLGIFAPEQISLVCKDASSILDWCVPSISRITWDPEPILRRVLRWTENVRRGQEDRGQNTYKARFEPVGTVGPAAVG
ncbi:MAG: substrate-binding domain-containing protein, partial [Opitutales bacterium]